MEKSRVRLEAEIAAHIYAVSNNIFGYALRVKENRKAASVRVPAWDVFLKANGDKRGKHIYTVWNVV